MPIRPEMLRRYPRDWVIRSKFIRHYRARNLCEWCGAANGQPHPITGSKVVLTVAHVFDKRPEAASLLNLAALCQRCHLAHDAPDRRRDRAERRHRGNRTFAFLDLVVEAQPSPPQTLPAGEADPVPETMPIKKTGGLVPRERRG